MANKGKNNPIAVYSVVSQIALIILLPLLFFIMGGTWLVEKFSLPEWLNIVFVFLGIFTMIYCAVSYLRKLIKMFDDDQRNKYTNLKHDPKDNDYYDESHRKKKP